MKNIQSSKRTKKVNKQIEVNIKRRTVIVDDKLVFHKGVPIPSWIELSLIDVCNRTCSFCPKSDPKVAPNTHQKMNMSLINKLTEDEAYKKNMLKNFLIIEKKLKDEPSKISIYELINKML